MDKVKVTKKQADRIEYCKAQDAGFETFMKFTIARWDSPENQCLNDLTPEQQASAWINGYEVELTPHEKILEFYKTEGSSESIVGHTDYTIGKRSGIATTLSVLGITIEGIND